MFHVSARVPCADFLISKRPPLAPSNPNACPRFPNSMTLKVEPSTVTERRQRFGKSHSPRLKPEQLKDQRRHAFLNKVRQASDDKRWDCRSDQILRQDFLMRQQEWESEQANLAPPEPSSPQEDLGDFSNSYNTEDIDMVDQIMSQQDEESRALISLLDETNGSLANTAQSEDPDEDVSEFGNETEDYDRLFLEVAMQQEQQQPQISTSRERPFGPSNTKEFALQPERQAQLPASPNRPSSSPKAQKMDIS